MRKQLFWYNTGSVLIALLTLLAVFFAILVKTTEHYLNQDLSVENTGSIQVQAQLDSWSTTAATTPAWTTLDGELQPYGYRLHVSRDGQEVYSTLDETQTQIYNQVGARIIWAQEGAIAVQNGEFLLVGRQTGDYSVVAVPQPDLPEFLGQQRMQGEVVMIALAWGGVAAVAVIFLLSLAFSHLRVKRMMRPVNALVDGAQRVGQGDFSQPVDSYKSDEFAAVCGAFNHMQEHLLHQRERADAYEQARTDLVSGISHDLRTPLTSVKGYIKGLRDGVANTPEKQEQYLDVAYRKACTIDVLLQRLFYFSKLESGSLSLQRESTDLGDFAQSFVQEAQGELAAVGGSIQLKGLDEPRPVYLDTEQMYRVLSNLTDNALHYAEATPLILRLHLWREGNNQHLRFSDNGVGVPEEQLPLLFDRFWRGSQARESQDGDNSGLGLYIVKYIVEAHGGTVTVQNEGGLVFDITLPGGGAEA